MDRQALRLHGGQPDRASNPGRVARRRRSLLTTALVAALVLGAAPLPAGVAHADTRSSANDAGRVSDGAIAVSLPAGVTADDIREGDRHARDAVAAAASARVKDVEARSDPAEQTPVIPDIVVAVDDAGDPILPEATSAEPAASAAPAVGTVENELRFTFDSPANPWTPEELAMLEQAAATYPVVRELYGEPFWDLTVNVRKNPALGGAYYNPSTNEMVLRGAEPDLLVHEMVHAFRDDYWIQISIFEEGMARAVEVEVLNRFRDLPYWDRDHSYGIDENFEFQNESVLGSAAGGFGDGYANALERYQMTGVAWWKALVEDPTYLVDFNRAYGELMFGGGPYSEPVLVDLLASVLTEVEGVPFRDWYRRQGIFDTRPPVGPFMHVKEGRIIYLATRADDGHVTMEQGRTLTWRAIDTSGAVIGQGEGITTRLGWVWAEFTLPDGAPTRLVDFMATALAPSGAPVEMTLPVPLDAVNSSDIDFGVPGVVPGAEGGTVRFTSLDGAMPAVTVPVERGAFAAPQLEGVGGRFLATYTGADGVSFARRFTKDRALYLLLLADPGLSVQLADTTDPVPSGGTIRYEATVTTAGISPANSVVVHLPVPTGTTFLSAEADDGSCALERGAIVCGFGRMAPGTSKHVRIDLRAVDAGTVTATATVAAREQDPDPSDETATEQTIVTDVDTSPPETLVSRPSRNQSLPAGPLTTRGTATDDRAVEGVDVAVQNRVTGKWLRANGTWGAFRKPPTTLSTPGATSTAWGRNLPALPKGSYGIWARARDAAGNADPTATWTPFTVK